MSLLRVFLGFVLPTTFKNSEFSFSSATSLIPHLTNIIDAFIRTSALITFFMAFYALFGQHLNLLSFFFLNKKKWMPQGKDMPIPSESQTEKHVLELIKRIRALPFQENESLKTNAPKHQLLGQSFEFYPEVRNWFLKNHPFLYLADPQLANDAFDLKIFENKIGKCRNTVIRDNPIIKKLINKSMTFSEGIKSIVFELCQRNQWMEIELLQSCMPAADCLTFLHYQIELWRHHDEGGLHCDLMNIPLILAPSPLLYILSCPRYSLEFKQFIIMQLSCLPLVLQKKDIFRHEKYLQLLMLLASASPLLRCCIVRWLELYLHSVLQCMEDAAEKNYLASQLGGKWTIDKYIVHFCGLKAISSNFCQEKKKKIDYGKDKIEKSTHTKY